MEIDPNYQARDHTCSEKTAKKQEMLKQKKLEKIIWSWGFSGVLSEISHTDTQRDYYNQMGENEYPTIFFTHDGERCSCSYELKSHSIARLKREEEYLKNYIPCDTCD